VIKRAVRLARGVNGRVAVLSACSSRGHPRRGVKIVSDARTAARVRRAVRCKVGPALGPGVSQLERLTGEARRDGAGGCKPLGPTAPARSSPADSRGSG